jgi:ATP-dependent DNA helicase RecQ
MPNDPVALLRQNLGYAGFRPGQEELVRATLAGRDALGILPTGGGKSVCYQVPALALGGMTLVLTPLVSLMEDQAARARGAGLAAAYLSAAQPPAEKRATERAVVERRLDILFVSPERLELDSFRTLLRAADVRLLAVDEAHCIAEWGDDFRPSYRRIGEVRSWLGCPVLALTATATPRVREEIRSSLSLRRPVTVVKSFDRPNLAWSVARLRGWHLRVSALYRILGGTSGIAIVYAPTRRQVEATRDSLAARGLRTEGYHAGLPGEERTRVQDVFMAGGCRVVVATNAFGMGIDKADVRVVVHLHLPSTLEGYYQEAGRAGRDGAPAQCVAFHHPDDRRLGNSFVDRSHPSARSLRRLHRLLLRQADGLGIATVNHDVLARRLGRRATPGDIEPLLQALARTGTIRLLGPGPEGSDGTGDGSVGSLISRLGVRGRPRLSRAIRLRRNARAKLGSVDRYARSRRCRRQSLLAYFGEEAPSYCGACDRCRDS